jgi:hypothetical protein
VSLPGNARGMGIELCALRQIQEEVRMRALVSDFAKESKRNISESEKFYVEREKFSSRQDRRL